MADLPSLAKYLIDNGPVKVSPTSRRVRVLFNHTYIVDTTSAIHVWEHDKYPQYYIPQSALKRDTTKTVSNVAASSGRVGATIVEIIINGPKGATPRPTNRVIFFASDEKDAGKLAGLVRLEFGSMDQWFEEEVPIYVHPKDLFKRVDILPSTRHIEVKLDGQTLASSNFSYNLLETTLPTRYYIPYTSVNVEFLRTSNLLTKCPYKGDAEYFDIAVEGKEYKNLVWWYRIPTAESAQVAGMLCFYNEKVDIILDGVLQERPKTQFA